jgi:hypothetical protein
VVFTSAGTNEYVEVAKRLFPNAPAPKTRGVAFPERDY